jgi:hypothetical protein
MFAILHALGMLIVDLFKSRSRLEAENLFLRHQLNIALRRAPPCLRLRRSETCPFRKFHPGTGSWVRENQCIIP